ncbi:AAA family ATPase [Leifsonia poae]|uniref:AAA family ATPase n=1 Tax=Leifsonia poae TaxID=110933 RepID=UPI001CC13326|nr:AAA family ATPase [Leifsonia poae]
MTPRKKLTPRVPKPQLLTEAETQALTAPPKPRSVADLLTQDFPILDWIVPDVIPDGCHLIVAAPKIGKSLLTLMLAIACATGERAFGAIKVRPRPVLLLDLESGDRRLAKRLTDFGMSTVPDTFEFHTDAETALAVMREFMEKHKGQSPLVILDTLSEVMGPKPRDLAPMLHEKRTLQPIQRLCADDPGASVLIVHHNRKDKTGDSVDSSSGTHGLTGAVDGIFVLDRPDRQQPEATLIRNSRDIEDATFGMTLKAVVWTFDGRSAGKARQAAEDRRIREQIERQGKVGHKLLALLKEHGPLTPAEAFELYDGDAKIQTVRNALNRLALRDLASKDSAGRYSAKYPLSWVSFLSWVATQTTQATRGAM